MTDSSHSIPGLTAEQLETILALLEKHLPKTTAWIYGSRTKGTARPWSDLDMVVFTTPEKQMAVSDLRDAFDESDLPFRVDLFSWNDIPASFKTNIRDNHITLNPWLQRR